MTSTDVDKIKAVFALTVAIKEVRALLVSDDVCPFRKHGRCAITKHVCAYDGGVPADCPLPVTVTQHPDGTTVVVPSQSIAGTA